MKVAIKKAIAGGFDVASLIDESIKGFYQDWYIIQNHVMEKDKGSLGINFYTDGAYKTWSIDLFRLIFGTNFIECLVGESEWECELKLVFKDEALIKRCPNGATMREMGFTSKSEKYRCPDGSNILFLGCRYCNRKIFAAEYHRAQMSNLKDVGKLKEYVRGLV